MSSDFRAYKWAVYLSVLSDQTVADPVLLDSKLEALEKELKNLKMLLKQEQAKKKIKIKSKLPKEYPAFFDLKQ